MKWCQNKTEVFISSLTDWLWYPFVFFIFVPLQCAWYHFCQLITDAIVCWCEEKRENVICSIIAFCVSSFFCIHHTDWVEWVLCLILVPHSIMVLLFLQCHYLWICDCGNCLWISFVYLLSSVTTTQIDCSECCVWFQSITQWCCSCVSNIVTCWCDEKGKEWIVGGCFLCVFFLFCLHSTNWYKLMTCLISTPHSMMLPLCFQCHCLLVILKGLVICWWMSFVCLLSFVFTTQVECRECCIWFQCLTQWYYSCVSNLAHCWYE